MEMNELKPYVIRIEETLSRNIIIRAENEEDALMKADVVYRTNGDVILTADDYSDNEVYCKGEATEDDLRLYTEYGGISNEQEGFGHYCG